jgi:hypothetical protein
MKKLTPKNREVGGSTKVVKNLGGGDTETILERSTDGDSFVRNNVASTIKKGQTRVGLSKGCTLNMGNYQSAKIDCWIERVVEDDEVVVMDTLADISRILDEHIEYESSNLVEKQEEEKPKKNKGRKY